MMQTEINSPHYSLLRSCAAMELNTDAENSIIDACKQDLNWDLLTIDSEKHGLSALLFVHLKSSGARVPESTLNQLKALYLRHRTSIQIRVDAVCEILDVLDNRQIPVILLKGIALAHLIYPEPGLRPMRDIDLLIPEMCREEACESLCAVGYSLENSSVIPADHHHLPPIAKNIQGLHVSLELHHEAIAPDNIGSLRFENLSAKPTEFKIGKRSAFTLGPVDMIRHLCRHTLEPQQNVKLGSTLDTLAYAACFAESIDWLELATRYPEVITSLQMFGYLIPWPHNLDQYLKKPPLPAPANVGIGMMPLSQIRQSGNRIQRLLNPSDWWLRGYYGIPVNRSLLYTKSVTHPLKLGKWLLRRFIN